MLSLLIFSPATYPVSHQLSFSISKETITHLLSLSLGTAGIYLTTKGIGEDATKDNKAQQYKIFSGIGMVVLSIVILSLPSKGFPLWVKG